MPGAALHSSNGAGVPDRAGPPWLMGALDAPFFTPCPEHTSGGFSHKTDRNFFCLDCQGDALCTFCVDASHKDHDILQIRRASHNNAVRVNEIPQVNTEGVQQYTINGSKILFLKGRKPPQPWRGGYHFCEMCGRSLLDAMRFCSLACKVGAVHESSDPLLSMQPGVSSKGTMGERKPGLSKRDHKRVKREEVLKHSKRQFQQQREAAAAASKQEASWKLWREAVVEDGEGRLREMIREVLDMVGFDEQPGSKRGPSGDPEFTVVPKKRKRSHLGHSQPGEAAGLSEEGDKGEGCASSSAGEELAVRSGDDHAESSKLGLPSSSSHSHTHSGDEAMSGKRKDGEGRGMSGSNGRAATHSGSGVHTADSGLALSSSGMQEPEEVSTKPFPSKEECLPSKKFRMEGGGCSDNERSCLSEPHTPVTVLRQRSGNFGQRVAALPPAIVF